MTGRACRYCGAPIVFGSTRFGKPMPLDAEPNPAGNVELLPDGSVFVHTSAPVFLTGTLHMPHWATCPHAGEARKDANRALRVPRRGRGESRSGRGTVAEGGA